MDNVKNDNYYNEKMMNDMRFIIKHMDNVTYADFSKDEVLQDSMMFRLIQISENARKLTDSFREKNAEIPWFDIFGLRNRIVHEYGHVDLNIVFETLAKDIPSVLQTISEKTTV